MISELNHRVENTLATSQDLGQHALRGADTVLRRAFDVRLTALSAAQDVITRESWEGASLSDVAEAALRAHAWQGRILLRKPALRPKSKTLVALVMGLHELCTIATKHGALFGSAKQASLDRGMTGQVDARRLFLTWQGRGGPAVAPPKHRGFASRLVERARAQDLFGDVRILFERAGVICSIGAPLPLQRADLQEKAA